jgi:uracil-DNA glycosylase family 4
MPEINYLGERPDLFCLGESPGVNENATGNPFVGKAGDVLRAVVDEVTPEFILDNPARCFSDHKPRPDELEACKPNWQSVVAKHRPKVIVALGNYAAEAILGKKIKISAYVGLPMTTNISGEDYVVVFNYHPSYILRGAHKKDTEYEKALTSWLNTWDLVRNIIEVGVEEEPEVTILKDGSDVIKFLKWLRDIKLVFAYDYETWGDVDCLRPELNNDFRILSVGVGIGNSREWGQAVSFPFDTMEHDVPLDIQCLWQDVIETPGRLAQNAKYEHKCNLRRFGHTALLNDTMLAMNVIDELATAKLEAIGCYCKIPWAGYKLRMANIQKDPLSVPLDQLLKYSALDGALPYECWQVLFKEIRKLGLGNILQMQQQFALYLAHVEMNGIHIDRDAAADVRIEMARELEKARKEFHDHKAIRKTEKWAVENIKSFKKGDKFNPKSPVQMRHLCLKLLKLKVKPPKKKWKDGKWVAGNVKLDKLVLEKFEDEYPVLKSLAKVRSIGAMFSGFLDKYEDYTGPDGCVHTSYMQEIVVTGRLSSRDPNLQNAPLDSPIRKVFNSRYKNGWVIAADYAQSQPRIIASMSGDRLMCEALNSGKDLHRFVGSEIYKVDYDDVTDKQRHIAKRKNLGTIFGQTPEGLAEACNIPLDEAKGIVAIYDNTFSNVRKYTTQKHKEAIRYGFVKDLFGAVRHLRDAQSQDLIRRERALRQAGNFPIQSTDNRFHLIALCVLCQYLIEREIEAVVINAEHDKLYVDCANHALGVTIETTREAMLIHNRAWYWKDMPVPMKVDIKYGKNLYEMRKWE